MNTELKTDLDRLRTETLARIDGRERAFRLWLIAAGLMEAICLIAFILLADFSNRIHLLMLISALLVYGTLAFGLFALGAFTQTWCRRILTAIELSQNND